MLFIGYYYGTALEAAARCGLMKMDQRLLDAGAEVNKLEGRWGTALRAALVRDHASVVQIMLDHGADMDFRLTRQRLYINNSEKASENALQLGVKSGNLDIVKTPLANGANVADDEPETLHPLILAVQTGNVAIVEELLDAGAPMNIHGKERPYYSNIQAEDASPIHAAIAGGHSTVVQLLVSRGADIENHVEGVGPPLGVAASKSQTEICRLLLAAGAIPHNAALSHAVRNGNIAVAQDLLAAGSKAALVLTLGCQHGRLDILELLPERIYDGDSPESVVDEAFTIQGLDDAVFRLMLEYTAPTQRRFRQVCTGGSVASAKSMLKSGAININHQDEKGWRLSLTGRQRHICRRK